MLKIFLFILSMMILTGCPSGNSGTTEATKAGLLPGTENPVIKECNSGKAYMYKDYEIHVEPSPELEGMNIFLYSPDVSRGNPCGIDRKNASHIIGTGETEGNNFFAGIYGNYLFIDQGTGPDLRVLSVYDLSNKELVLYTGYSDAELKDGELTYFKTLVPKPGVVEQISCPDAAKWKEQGLTVLYEQRENFNLNTETRVPVEEYRCRAGQ
jgi:hypothetical protein